MSKVIVGYIPKINNGYKKIINFSNENERDLFINQYFEDYKQRLEDASEKTFKITSSIYNSIDLGISLEEIDNANYIIIKQNDNITFHFLNDYTNLGNNNKFNLNIEKDLPMNNLGFISNLKGYNLIKGHGDNKNYLSSTFDFSKNIKSLKKIENSKSYEIFNTPYLYVMEKITSSEVGLRKISQKGTYQESFKVKIAPLYNIHINGGADIAESITLSETLKGNTSNVNENKENIVFGSEVVSSLSIYYEMDTATITGSDGKTKTTTLKKEWLPLNGDSNLYLMSGTDRDASDYNEILADGGIINDDIEIQDQAVGLVYNPINIRYFPVVIEATGLSSYTIRPATLSELNYYIPNAYFSQSGITQGNNKYYHDMVSDNENGSFNNISSSVETTPFNVSLILKNGYNNSLESVWNSVALINYLTDEEKNANVISAKISNFNPLLFKIGTDFSNFSYDDINNINDLDNGIYELDYIQYDDTYENNHYLIEHGLSNIELIEGIRKFDMTIENQKLFNLDAQFLKDGKLEFYHFASISPEWEERIKFITDDLKDPINEDNSWMDEKEMSYSQNDFSIYKANNPSTSKLFPLQQTFNLFKSGLMGSLLNKGSNQKTVVDNNNNPIKSKITPNLRGYGGTIAGLTASVINMTENIFARRDMKRKPNEITGTSSALNDLLTNYNGVFFSLIEYQFNDYSRDATIEAIKREGMVYEGNFINDYENIKRPVFNYIQIESLFKANEYLDLNNQELGIWEKILTEGTYIFNDYSKFPILEVDNNGD